MVAADSMSTMSKLRKDIVSENIYNVFFKREGECGLAWSLPKKKKIFTAPFNDWGLLIRWIIPFTVLWYICKERND